MKLSEFKFELPNNLIALDPAENRDESRLMVVHKDTGKIEHKIFKDVVDYFKEGDVMVGNAPVPPEGYEIARIDVVVRLRRKPA